LDFLFLPVPFNCFQFSSPHAVLEKRKAFLMPFSRKCHFVLEIHDDICYSKPPNIDSRRNGGSAISSDMNLNPEGVPAI